jgi:hypothetical protein
MLLSIGKNIHQGEKIYELHQQIDLAGTTGSLIGFKTPFTEGNELFNSNYLSR